MSVSATIRIGRDEVDISRPCDVATALKKMQLRLATGGVRETVRLDGEEVTYSRASDSRLASLIALYEGLCSRETGGRRSRFAKRVRFT